MQLQLILYITMPRVPVALALPFPLPPAPTEPLPTPSPLQNAIQHTVQSTDYDAVVIPLTNEHWQNRWDRLCLRPMDDEGDEELQKPEAIESREREREIVDREADLWRKDGGLLREECNITRLVDGQRIVACAAEWLELDSPDEGIRFDAELVSAHRPGRSTRLMNQALRAEMAHAIYLSLGTLIIPSPILANRAYLPSYARVISNLLQMGGAAAHTNISIRIPISDPFELIGQGPANPQINRNSNSQHNGQSSISGPDNTTNAPGAAGKHRRVGSLSTRPQSVHQNLPVTMQNMRVPSGASAASSTMSAQSNVPASSGGDPSSTWEMWDTIRSLCGYHPRLSISKTSLWCKRGR